MGQRALTAARTMVGVRFRSHGSEPHSGLDCVGLVWAGYAAAGRRLVRPCDYPLRGWSRAQVEAGLAAAGFVPAAGAGRDGDVALIALDAGQFHLGLMGTDRLVHAHAGLRGVVETPVDGWGEAALWRLKAGGGRFLPSSSRT